jgi:hypothetical protein
MHAHTHREKFMLTRTNMEKQIQRESKTHRKEKHTHRENTADEKR